MWGERSEGPAMGAGKAIAPSRARIAPAPESLSANNQFNQQS